VAYGRPGLCALRRCRGGRGSFLGLRRLGRADGKISYTEIVNQENIRSTDPESAGGWHIVDFASSVKRHPAWWIGGKPSTAPS
jgi:hypothetical protein